MRIATRLRVSVECQGRRLQADSEDLSRRGIFIRTSANLPVGAPAMLGITTGDGRLLRVRARVAHVLVPTEARALGRSPGIGFEFDASHASGLTHVVDLHDALATSTQGLTGPARVLSILIADSRTPLLVRLTNALERSGRFVVDSVNNGADALVSILENRPDALMAAADMPHLGGIDLLGKLRSHERLRDLPVVLMLEEDSDLVRLEAYRLGADDVINKPFTDEEVLLRLRRTCAPPRAQTGGGLSGQLSEIALGTVLSLLDFEHKTGVLRVNHGSENAAIRVRRGRVVGIDGPAQALEPLDRLMCVLDWTRGQFEFDACDVADTDLALSVQQLLLEHAQVVDEG